MREYARRTALICSLLLLLSGCNSDESPHTIKTQAVDCNAAQSRCQVDIDGLEVALSLQSEVVPLKPFSVTAEIKGGEGIEQLIVDFQMVGMAMGPNRYRLVADEHRWRGTSTLPVCTTSRSDWLAIMEFTHAKKQYSVSFPFTTQ